MKKSLISLIGVLLITATLYSQDDLSTVKVIQLTDKLYKIELFDGFEVNMLAFIGEDGLLLVDTGFKGTAQKLKDELNKYGHNKPSFIISTHEHTDHIGGNFVFGKEPVIIGHRNLKSRMEGDDYIFEEYSKYEIPEITFNDSLSLFFNDEEIRIISIQESHTDNDIMIHFTKSGYAYLGDVAYGMHFPTVDLASGNNSRYASIVKYALDLLPQDTKFISGHGRDLCMEEMREWQQMLEETISVIHTEMNKGKDIATMQEEKIIDKWKKYVPGGYISTSSWIENVANGFNNVKPHPTPEAKYYYAYKNGGVEDVKKAYREVRNSEYGDGEWQPYILYSLANYITMKEEYTDAIEVFKFCISEYPNDYYFYDGLGNVYLKNRDMQSAIKYYKKSLEIEPLNTNATTILKKLNYK